MCLLAARMEGYVRAVGIYGGFPVETKSSYRILM